MQPEEKNVEKVGAASEESTLIKSTVRKATEITKDDALTSKIRKAATEKILN